jgi:hypothetical protein
VHGRDEALGDRARDRNLDRRSAASPVARDLDPNAPRRVVQGVGNQAQELEPRLPARVAREADLGMARDRRGDRDAGQRTRLVLLEAAELAGLARDLAALEAAFRLDVQRRVQRGEAEREAVVEGVVGDQPGRGRRRASP